jgi:glyoxylase-like metal-dependent hydrolase (beta-lactamase superfamily II)
MSRLSRVSGCVTIPAVLLAGLIGPAGAQGGPVSQGPDPAQRKAASEHLERIIAPAEPSRAPKALRQGEFLAPQSVSAVAINPEGRQLAVTTMAFRHDRNFWLLDHAGRVLWGRYLEPWAPGRVAFLPQGKHLAVGLAYSRFTDPNPTLALFSCWNGRLCLVRGDGTVQAAIDAGGPARLRWSADGRFAIAGTSQGETWRVEADGTVAWHVRLPVRQAPPVDQPLKPVFEGIPIYRVGRVGPEHAYVGDIWLIKTQQGGILVDSGGTSGVSLTLERIKAAGVEPRQVHYLLLTHTHGDHIGGAYLWRSMGAQVVAPAPAAFPATWMIPTLNHYGIWAPCAIDQPLPLARPGDTTHLTLDGLDIQAIFVPGHSFDSVVYVLNLAGRRVFLMGDIGFHGNNDILNRCWGDVPKARTVMEVLRKQVLPLEPEIVFTGHDEHSNGVEYWQSILRTTEESIRKAEARRNQVPQQ